MANQYYMCNECKKRHCIMFVNCSVRIVPVCEIKYGARFNQIDKDQAMRLMNSDKDDEPVTKPRIQQPEEQPHNRFADIEVGQGYDFIKCRKE